MISVEQAFERIVGKARPLGTEKVDVARSSGRVIAAPIRARRSQPGSDLSAMDGYAVRSEDLTNKIPLTVVGESAAGHPYGKALDPGEAVRIFTGAMVPDGADQVVIQENATKNGSALSTDQPAQPNVNIRKMGIDFLEKQCVLEAGTFMTAKSIGLAASAGQAHLMVHRAPKIALLATGDELAEPGKKAFRPYDTVDSARPQVQALAEEVGARVVSSSHAGDTEHATADAINANKDADILVTIGGASVGDKDLVQQVLKQEGMELDFWKIAMRPGKPLIYGKRGNQYVLGLPGNPASAFVCSLIFLRPLIDRLMGRPAPLPTGVPLPCATSLPLNGPRQHYMRARLIGEPGQRMVDPAASQDSSLSTVLAQCDGLIVRPPNAPAVPTGKPVMFLPF